MKKEKGKRVLLGYGKTAYSFNGVRYLVGARFVKPDFCDSNNNIEMSYCIEHHLKSGFAQLKTDEADDIMSDTYACRAAGKED